MLALPKKIIENSSDGDKASNVCNTFAAFLSHFELFINYFLQEFKIHACVIECFTVVSRLTGKLGNFQLISQVRDTIMTSHIGKKRLS